MCARCICRRSPAPVGLCGQVPSRANALWQQLLQGRLRVRERALCQALPPGRVRCGKKCCPSGQRCIDARRSICARCRSGEHPCGKTCCPKGKFCCGDDNGGTCCSAKTGRCCIGTDAAGRTRFTCCTKPNKCAQQGNTAGLVEGPANYVCCPPDRYVPGPNTCCPPGYTSMGGKLVVVGGLCCPNDQVCGSGSTITCCESQNKCQNGTCVPA
jgi:hypothetical protein